MLDRSTRQIIRALQRDAMLSVQQLAEQVGLSTTPVWRRIKALEDQRLIRRRVTLMDREQLGLSICVYAHVTLERHNAAGVQRFERLVNTFDEVMECASTTGDSDYLLKIVAPDMKAYERFLQEKLFSITGVASIRSNVVLRELKYETALPISD
jgi:DNA-binding Lrp family transcriptional regulator